MNVKISPDGKGGFIASGLPDGTTKHVLAGHVNVRVDVADERAQPLGGVEFLVPYEDVKNCTPQELGVRYGEPYFSCLQNLLKGKL